MSLFNATPLLTRPRFSPALSKMDRVFFAKVRRYVSERGQSPYVRTVAGMQGTISSLTSAVAKSKASSSAGTSTSTSSAQQQRPDFYGESVRSVADYRAWLRRQQRWSRDHLGADARPIRGVRVGQ